MAEESPPSFTTRRRALTGDESLQWGGNDGESWSDAVESSSGVTVTDSGAVQSSTAPDTEVYLHDEWGDVSLTGRNGQAEFSYSGVSGVYRPAWATVDGDPSVNASDQLLLAGTNGDAIRTNLNLDFSSTITWEYSIDVFKNLADNSEYNFVLFASDSKYQTSYGTGFYPGYRCHYKGNGELRLERYDSNGNRAAQPIDIVTTADPSTVQITREPAGNWEISVNGTVEATATDNVLETATVTGYSIRSTRDHEATINEMKIY